jgi:hypothetical protein
METISDPGIQQYVHSPCEIIGSIVKQWPGFITPTALFSEKGKSKNVK